MIYLNQAWIKQIIQYKKFDKINNDGIEIIFSKLDHIGTRGSTPEGSLDVIQTTGLTSQHIFTASFIDEVESLFSDDGDFSDFFNYTTQPQPQSNQEGDDQAVKQTNENVQEQLPNLNPNALSCAEAAINEHKPNLKATYFAPYHEPQTSDNGT